MKRTEALVWPAAKVAQHRAQLRPTRSGALIQKSILPNARRRRECFYFVVFFFTCYPTQYAANDSHREQAVIQWRDCRLSGLFRCFIYLFIYTSGDFVARRAHFTLIEFQVEK